MRIRAAKLASLVLAGSVALVGCGGGTTVTTILATVGTPQVVASGFAFEPANLEVVSGTAIELELANRDNAPHNISIYRDATAAQKLFGGEVVNGPGSVVYQVPALPAGSFWFRCDIHPDMHGTIVAS